MKNVFKRFLEYLEKRRETKLQFKLQQEQIRLDNKKFKAELAKQKLEQKKSRTENRLQKFMQLLGGGGKLFLKLMKSFGSKLKDLFLSFLKALGLTSDDERRISKRVWVGYLATMLLIILIVRLIWTIIGGHQSVNVTWGLPFWSNAVSLFTSLNPTVRVFIILGILYLIIVVTVASIRPYLKKREKKQKQEVTEQAKYDKYLKRNWYWYPWVIVPPGYAADVLFLGRAYRYWRRGIAFKLPALEDILFIDMRIKVLQIKTEEITTAGLLVGKALEHIVVPEDTIGWYKAELTEEEIQKRINKRLEAESKKEGFDEKQKRKEIEDEERKMVRKLLAAQTRGAQGSYSLLVNAYIKNPLLILEYQPEIRSKETTTVLSSMIASLVSAQLQTALPEIHIEDCYELPSIVLLAGNDRWDLLGFNIAEKAEAESLIQQRDKKNDEFEAEDNKAKRKAIEEEIRKIDEELGKYTDAVLADNEGIGRRRWLDVLTEKRITIADKKEKGEKKKTKISLAKINLTDREQFDAVIKTNQESVLAQLNAMGVGVSAFTIKDFNPVEDVAKLIDERTKKRMQRQLRWVELQQKIDEETTERNVREIKALGSGRTITAQLEILKKWVKEITTEYAKNPDGSDKTDDEGKRIILKEGLEWKPTPEQVLALVPLFEFLRTVRTTKNQTILMSLGEIIPELAGLRKLITKT